MGSLHGTKALEAWCKQVTSGYAGVNILNMTTSWRSGLGFCAVIHHHCPDLIDFENLDPDDMLGNNELAFQVAEQHLGIPSLLDPRDMVECELLDRLSILTYLSQYYQAFHSQALQNRVRVLGGSVSKSSSVNSDMSDSAPTRQQRPSHPTLGRVSDPCRLCGKPVFILERLHVGGGILHRTCFKCARCETQLSLAGYYETESGEYCCDLCPDEEHKEIESQQNSQRKAQVDSEDDSGNSSQEEEEENPNLNNINSSTASPQQPSIEHNSNSQSTTQHVERDSCYKTGIQTSLDLNDNVQPDSHVLTSELNHNVQDGHEHLDNKPPVLDAVDNHGVACSTSPAEETTRSEGNDECLSSIDPPALTTNSGATTASNDVNDNESVTFGGPMADPQVCKDTPTHSSKVEKEAVIAGQGNDSLNPFGDDFEEEEEGHGDTVNLAEKNGEIEIKSVEDASQVTEPTSAKDESKSASQSLNPFGSDIESDEEEKVKPAVSHTSLDSTTQLHRTPKSQATLNPFGSDLSSDDEAKSSLGSVSPSPSTVSGGTTRQRHHKKKRRAPLPPTLAGSQSRLPLPRQQLDSASTRSPSTPTSRSRNASGNSPLPVPAPRHSLLAGSASDLSGAGPCSGETVKRIKDENNMNRRSQILESLRGAGTDGKEASQADSGGVTGSAKDGATLSSNGSSRNGSAHNSSLNLKSGGTSGGALSQAPSFNPLPVDKADLDGQWRKKKGPAPPRPIPPRRAVKKLARKVINQELEDIEVKQGELERQGVKLEKTIRELCAKSDAEEGADRDSLGPEAEDLIIQLFDLVNEKNELFRRQTELIYMKKENRLEEQHADLEYQIRVLMSKPDSQRTPEDQAKEEKLIAKLVQVVGLRNQIVDCLEMDRLRELDEDTAIEDHMSNYAAVKPPAETRHIILSKLMKKRKKKRKDRENEKDIDTSEHPEGGEVVAKEHADEGKKKKSTKKRLLSYASKKLTTALPL